MVVLALIANAGIAVAKLIAGLFTGSGAMLAEAVHSFADAGNQGLLLLGGSRSRRPRDERHPLGYGREAYFWAMLVAVLLFFMGGLYSLYEGIHKLQEPAPLKYPQWAIAVLIFGMLLEGYSFLAALKEGKRVRGEQPLGAWSRDTGNVNLLVVIYEDAAAMLGLMIALLAICLTWLTGNPLWDALGTLVIAVLLLVVAVFLAKQIHRLIVGFRASREIEAGIRAMWQEADCSVLDLITTWNGPESILVSCKIRPRNLKESAEQLIYRINAIERQIVAAYPAVSHLFVEPDITRGSGEVA